MKMTQAELIAHYEKQLEKVIAAWSGKCDALGNDGESYIEFARAELEAVKNGRGW